MELNKGFLAGHLTKDIEIKGTNKNVATSTIAVNREYLKGDEKVKETSFIPFVAYGKLGGILAKYLKKGSPAFFIGRIKSESWEKEGQKKSAIKFVVEEFKFVGDKKKEDKPDERESDDESFSHDTDGDDAPF